MVAADSVDVDVSLAGHHLPHRGDALNIAGVGGEAVAFRHRRGTDDLGVQRVAREVVIDVDVVAADDPRFFERGEPGADRTCREIKLVGDLTRGGVAGVLLEVIKDRTIDRVEFAVFH